MTKEEFVVATHEELSFLAPRVWEAFMEFGGERCSDEEQFSRAMDDVESAILDAIPTRDLLEWYLRAPASRELVERVLEEERVQMPLSVENLCAAALRLAIDENLGLLCPKGVR